MKRVVRTPTNPRGTTSRLIIQTFTAPQSTMFCLSDKSGTDLCSCYVCDRHCDKYRHRSPIPTMTIAVVMKNQIFESIHSSPSWAWEHHPDSTHSSVSICYHHSWISMKHSLRHRHSVSFSDSDYTLNSVLRLESPWYSYYSQTIECHSLSSPSWHWVGMNRIV